MDPDYEIERELRREGYPTLNRILSEVDAFGGDRCSLVRRPEAGCEAGIFVALLTAGAVREVGPYLVGRAMELVPEHERSVPTPRLVVDFNGSLGLVFKVMEEEKSPFLWGSFFWCGRRILSAAFLGTALCERMAPELTRIGCPTRLC